MTNRLQKSGTLVVTQGTSNFFQDDSKEFKDKLDLLKDKIRELLNLKNVNFLFGSGTSSGAIPTMSLLFSSLKLPEGKELESKFNCIKAKCGENLEMCLSVMYAARTHYQGLVLENTDEQKKIDDDLKLYEMLIREVEHHIFDNININCGSEDSRDTLKIYKLFYQKLALRTKDNSRIRVFTTNNDLFNETALDSLNIHYINGFSGGLHKYFNPAIFNYTWSKRMDTSIDKFEPVENMVYLYKLHGSVNWQETENLNNSFFEIEEVPKLESHSDGTVLIYPTPTKQDKSLGSPYVDLFREFQNKLLEPHSVLFVIGYSFSDRHVNDIIYRALATNSTINVVIFGEKPGDEERQKKPIFFIDDNRVFTISGTESVDGKTKERKIHHFDYIVDSLLPNMDTFRNNDDLLDKFVKSLKSETKG